MPSPAATMASMTVGVGTRRSREEPNRLWLRSSATLLVMFPVLSDDVGFGDIVGDNFLCRLPQY